MFWGAAGIPVNNVSMYFTNHFTGWDIHLVLITSWNGWFGAQQPQAATTWTGDTIHVKMTCFLTWGSSPPQRWLFCLLLLSCFSKDHSINGSGFSASVRVNPSTGSTLDSVGKMPAENIAKLWFYGMIYSLWTVFFQQWDHMVWLKKKELPDSVNALQLPLT